MADLTSRDFKKPAHHEFYKALRSADSSHGRNFHNILEDWVLCAAGAIAQGANKIRTGAIDAKIEEDYTRVLSNYKADARDAFALGLAILVGSLEETHDFLGDVAGSAGVLNHWAGQFFTPWEVARMMSKMQIGEAQPSEKRIKIAEPACGAGAMMLAVTQDLRDAGFGPRHWWFDATDIDVRCFHMAYLQLSLCGAPGIVRHGDTLRMEFWKAWITPTGAMFPLREEAETAPDPQPTAAAERV